MARATGLCFVAGEDEPPTRSRQFAPRSREPFRHVRRRFGRSPESFSLKTELFGLKTERLGLMAEPLGLANEQFGGGFFEFPDVREPLIRSPRPHRCSPEPRPHAPESFSL